MKSIVPILSLATSLALMTPMFGEDESVDNPAADVAAKAESELFHPPVRLTAADGIIDRGASLGHCGPWVEDVDEDGVKDLVVGDFIGLFRFYRNLGTNQAPRYARPKNLQAGGVNAQVPIY